MCLDPEWWDRRYFLRDGSIMDSTIGFSHLSIVAVRPLPLVSDFVVKLVLRKEVFYLYELTLTLTPLNFEGWRGRW